METKVVYPAFSKRNFYFRAHISKFVIDNGAAPINPFMNFDYFLLDTVHRDLVRNANNAIIRKADELWIFGDISNGVAAEIELAKTLRKPIRYFEIIDSKEIRKIGETEAKKRERVTR